MNLFQKLKADELLRHASILFSGMMVVHVCNVLFQMAVSRSIPKEEYVLLSAFLSVLAMIQRPLGTLGTGLSHYSSILRREDRVGDVKRLLRKWLLLAGIPALLLGLGVLLASRELADFFHLNRVEPVVVTGFILPALFVIPVLAGTIQGLQMFRWSATANICNALVRLSCGSAFVWLLYPACGWALLGHGLGIYAGASALLLGLFLALHGRPGSQAPLPSLREYLFQSFLILASYAVLMNADVVLVKHFLPGDTEFAYAATLGRLVVFLPGAIVGSMFPKVASKGAGTSEQRAVFLRSLRLTLLCVGVAVAGCFLFSGLLARILFGIRDVSDGLQLRISQMALVMGISASLNVLVQYLVAQRRFLPAFSVVGFALLYQAGAALYHAGTGQIVLIAGLCNGGAFLCCLVMLFNPMRTRRVK